MEKKKSIKARNWVFTINNYDNRMLKQFGKVAMSLERHTYICFGLEKGKKTGTPHIQGYIELDDNQARTFTQNYFNLQKNGEILKFYLDPAKGTAKDSLNYTSKENQSWEYGTSKNETQGIRSDLDTLRERIFENPKSYNEILENETLNYQQIKYMQELLKVAFKHRNINMPPIVFWIYGSSGVGKTKLVYDSFGLDVCKVSNFKWLGTGYLQQECFLLDDLRPYSIDFDELLTLIDRYPTDVYFKGGSLPFNSSHIVITTPKSIEKTFGEFSESLKQMERRVTHEINLDLNPVEDLKNYVKKEPEF